MTLTPGSPAGTMIGCIPNNFLAVNAGCKLKEMTSLNELYDLKLIAISKLLLYSQIDARTSMLKY